MYRITWLLGYPSGAPEFTPVFSGVRVTRSLVLYVCFVDHCLSLCTFSFGHCVVCSSSIYGFWFPLWYLQTLPGCLTVSILTIYERWCNQCSTFHVCWIFSLFFWYKCDIVYRWSNNVLTTIRVISSM